MRPIAGQEGGLEETEQGLQNELERGTGLIRSKGTVHRVVKRKKSAKRREEVFRRASSYPSSEKEIFKIH